MSRKLSLLAVLVVLLGGFASVGPASAAPIVSKSFTWAQRSEGDCTRSSLTWTLNSDGVASFDGVFKSSSDDDAWLMWAHMKDAAGHDMGLISNADNQSADGNKFILNMPDHRQWYRWMGHGRFDPVKFSLITGMSLDNHC